MRRGAAAIVLIAAVVAGVATRPDPEPEAAGDADTTTTSADPVASTAPATAAIAPPDDGLPGTAGPVVDELALRPDGIGSYDFGTPAGEIVPAVTALLGPPENPGSTSEVVACFDVGGTAASPLPFAPASDEPTSATDVLWPDLRLTFAGRDPESVVLTGWAVYVSASDGRQMRMADGPVVSEALPAWQATYGDKVESVDDQEFQVSFPAGPVLVRDRSDRRHVSAGYFCGAGGA